jgi:hypothetical protein
MPDPKEMSGIPRPVDDLPNGAISVRLIRGALSNNITSYPVNLHIAGGVMTVKTDESGRAQFNAVPPGATVKASVDVDGEHLVSQEFVAPAEGGIRLMLVATDATKAAAPATTGTVVIGPQSRIVMEPREEAVVVYYMLDVSNSRSAPVTTAAPFAFEMPRGAKGCGVMQGSSPRATVTGTSVSVEPPFPPGSTFVQVGCEMPAATGSIDIDQRFPAALEGVAVVVKKVGETTLRSPQIREQRDLAANGETFIAATGGSVPAGQPLQLSVTGIPHHNPAPRRVALGLVAVIALVGVWAARGGVDDARAAERKRLLARREKLFNDLERVEHEHRSGRGDDRRYGSRRGEILTSLEQIYSALDDDAGADPAGRAGLASHIADVDVATP